MQLDKLNAGWGTMNLFLNWWQFSGSKSVFTLNHAHHPYSDTQKEMLKHFSGTKWFFLFLEVSGKKFYQSEQNCFVQNIYTAEIKTCNVEKCPCEPTRRREAVSPCCVCTGRRDFSRSDLTVQLVSQAEQVSVQSKQTWAGSSLEM